MSHPSDRAIEAVPAVTVIGMDLPDDQERDATEPRSEEELFDESRRRQDWLRASTEITGQLLSHEGEEPLQVIARRLQQIADADAVNVVLPTPGGQRLMVEVATAAGAEKLTALSYPMNDAVSALVVGTGQAVLIGDIAAEHDYTAHLSDVVPVGPLMVLPLVGTQRVRGALIVGRLQGRPRFTAANLEMATTFANHAAVALELADARADQERVALLEDHDRIAREGTTTSSSACSAPG